MSQFKRSKDTYFVLLMSRCIVLMLVAIFSLSTPAWAQTCRAKNVSSTPDRDFEDAGDGMVLHKPTGLIWKRCAEGQTWDGLTCTGEPVLIAWGGAFERVAAVNAAKSDSPAYPGWATYLMRFISGAVTPKPTEGAIQRLGADDWRLPNINELLSIVETSCEGPAVNVGIFPGFKAFPMWSSSPVADSPEDAWSLSMTAGLDNPSNRRESAFQIYLVRGGGDFLNFDSGVMPSVLSRPTEPIPDSPPSQPDAGLRFSPEAQSGNLTPRVSSAYVPQGNARLPESMKDTLPDSSGDDEIGARAALVAESPVTNNEVTVSVPSLETSGLGLLSLLLSVLGMRATRRK